MTRPHQHANPAPEPLPLLTAALAAALAAAAPAGENGEVRITRDDEQVHIAGPGAVVGVPLSGASPQSLNDALSELSRLGRHAAHALAQLRRQEQVRAEQTAERKAAELRERYATPTPGAFGLRALATDDLPDGVGPVTDSLVPLAVESPCPGAYHRSVVAHPGWVVQTRAGLVRAMPCRQQESHWHQPPLAMLLVTTLDGVPIGYVEMHADGQVSSEGAYARTGVSDLLGSRRRNEVRASNPWTARPAPAGTASVSAHVEELAAAASETVGTAGTVGTVSARAAGEAEAGPHGANIVDWVRGRVADDERAHQISQERKAQAREWAALSRSKDRIPTAKLQAWMRQESHLEHDSTGYVIGGVRVVSRMVSGRTRPEFLSPQPYRRQRAEKAVGVSEVLWVARLEHESVRFADRKRRSGHRFYDSEIQRLRDTMPGLIVQVPEDRQAIFVAVDSPEHRQALDAAIVEWVLLGDEQD